MKREEPTHPEDPMYGDEPTHSEDLMYGGESSSSTSPRVGDDGDGTEKPRKYDEVFLSFRGKDTGKGFTDFLYTSLVDAGIRVFKYDNEYRVGEETDVDLRYSIMQSKISIPTISENYASSKWCLRELVLMLECKKSKGQIVLPIFYKVEPSQVRHLKGRLGDAIDAHKENLDEMFVKEWEEALQEVSSLEGWESEKIDNGHEAALVKTVVKKVMSELKEHFQLIVPKQLVGIDDRVEHIMNLIEATSNGTRTVGICGMGGIGKTTLAKALYNKLSSQFEHLSFVTNIRETSQNKGIEYLQKQLIDNILRGPYNVSSVDEGISVIKSRFTSKKVLILLDDVDTSIQLDALAGDRSWFEAGSIVIITTRMQSILDEAKVDYTYQLKELSLDQSLTLFSRYAFRKDSPHSDYEFISRDVVSTTAGLPLALVSIGSFLYGKGEEVWKDTLENLKKVPDKKVQEKLRISYEALNYEERQIFLDVACFFTGSSKQNPIYMWDACGFFPKKGIEVLMPMSLIKMDKDGKLMMHDQLRDFGREIVRLENKKKPKKRSRVWTYEEAAYVLDNNKGTSEIEALRLDKYGSRNYTGEQFRELTNLRFLQVKGMNFIGDFQNSLPQLRWLHWEHCPSDFIAANFHLKKLVVLDLSRSEISEDWGGWVPLMMATELKVLNLTGCHSLRRTPDLSALISLEILILEDCKNLEEIHSSIGDSTTLVSLDVRRCRRLEELPAGVGRMKELRELLLDQTAIQEIPISRGCLMKLEILCASRCKRLARLPESIQSLVSLTQLDLYLTRIEGLPESIGSLKKLETLDVSYCSSLASLPSSIGHLTSLSLLDLTQCDKLTQLPNSIGSLVSLQRLLLRGCCSLEEIHDSIGKLVSLTELDLRFTAIAELPETIGNLQNLSTLDISGAHITELPGTIGMLLNLQELRASHCENLDGIPSNIGELISLNKLDLDKSGISSLPESISKLSSLQNLHVQYSKNLREIPGLPSGLTALGITCKSPILPHLSQLTLLKKLELSDCCGLEYLPELPIGLLTLSITRCGKLKALTNLSNLKHLTELYIDECFELTEVTGLEGLQYLSDLYVRQCPKISRPDGVGSLEFLRGLDIDEAFPDSLKLTSPNTSQLEGSLDLSNSKNLQQTIAGSCMKKSHLEATPLRMQREVSRPSLLLTKEKMKDEAGQRTAEVETSDRNFAIAAVENLVGIDDRVKDITDLLEMEVDDEVRIIVLHGTGGIGKTTLAKAVYNRISSCFNSCSFLAEVEETTQNPRGIQFLQTKLIRDILEQDHEDPSFDGRIELFLDIFREMKVLIVVDDVEKQSHLHAIVGDQLHWFGPGSRIIVTSKNSGLLKEYDPGKACNYMVPQLDDGQAFELLCRHAFRMQSSMHGYDGLAHSIVNATVKLPLVVEVIGSFLRGKSIEEWKKMEELMKQFMTNSQKTTVGCKEILDICYKALDPKQKKIFLDIAFFVYGVDIRSASYMWPSSYLPSSDCILMPLAKIGENNELQMHRLVRCLGKRILDQESEDPIPRNFSIHDMVPSAISRMKGMEKVEALCFDLDDIASCIFTAEDFESMPNIRFLKLDKAKVSGDFTGAFRSLRWLCWQKCPPDFGAINIILRELVIFDLSWSKVTEEWGGWREIKMERLKVLNLTGCSDLLITPNFFGYKYLEILSLERCSRLVKLHPSIGHLKSLVSLNLKFCNQLNRLPVELGCMTALKELFIDGTSIREIPISIGNLKRLKVLTGFKCFSLTHLPTSISYLTALSVLSLDGAKITKLPSSLGELLNLRRLSLRDCRYMKELPDSLGRMGSSLEELDISATSISKLPDSIRNLQNLRVLRMDSSFVRAFPGEIGNLTKLEELHASWCRSLKGAIPSDIKRLHHLRSLTLGHSSISSLPSEISTISSLHTLDLLQCNEIEVLPELPPSLICLRVSSKRMKSIPLLKELKGLEELYLGDEDSREFEPPSRQLMPVSKVKRLFSIWFSRLWNLELLQTQRNDEDSREFEPPSRQLMPVYKVKRLLSKWFSRLWNLELPQTQRNHEESFSASLPKLRKLELSLSQIISLHLVDGSTDIPQLKTLSVCGLSLRKVSELPKTLSVLSFRGCSSLKRLPSVQGLINVSVLKLYHSAIEEIEGIEGLKALKRLDISNCKIQNLNGIGQLTSLRSLILSDCAYLNSLPDLSNLKLLKALEIRQCKLIHRIEGLEELTSLEKLNISECRAENSVQVQNALKRLMARRMAT